LISASTTRLFTRLRSTRAQKSNRLRKGPPPWPSAPFARGHDGLDGALPRALHRAQAVAHQLVGDRLEAVHAAVHVGRLEADAEQLGVGQQHLQLVGVVASIVMLAA
jgi:hypothetical protein